MHYVDYATRAAIATVFVVAASSKGRNGEAFSRFARSISLLGAAYQTHARVLALTIVTGEAIVPLLILSPMTSSIGYALCIFLLSMFSIATARAVAARLHVPCRCFGADGSVLSLRHVARNGLIVLVALLVLLLRSSLHQSPGSGPGVLLAIGAGIFIGVCLVNWDELVFLAERPIGGASRDRSGS